jgi:SAM-dependent methyltransferase
MLQAIDGLELSILLPKFLAQVKSSTAPPEISVLDLGCGTGRNTAKLLTYPWPARTPIRITGLDFSSAMLDIAAKKLSSVANDSAKERVLQLECCDCFPTASNRSASPFPAVTGLKQQDAIISTLVLEHIPLSSFFATLSSLLVPSSLALLTNMHADMGQRSQAGFVNADGVKVRGESYIYTVEETVQAAQEAGFEVVDVREREVRRADMEGGFVGKRGWKWVGIKVWFAVVLRKGA